MMLFPLVTLGLLAMPLLALRSVSPNRYALTSLKVATSNKGEGDNVLPQLPPWLPAFGTAAVGGLLFGSDIGASSSVVRILGNGMSEFGALDALSLGQIASASLFGAMIASAAIIGLGDSKIGRQLELRVASVLFTIGTVIQSFGGTFSIMMLGRVIYGLGIGTAMHVAPLYIAETSPDNLRGRLVSLKEAAIVLGIVIGYLAGSVFGGDGNWRSVFASVLPLEALMLIGSLIVPESPRWLALRGRSAEAVDSLVQVQGLPISNAQTQVNEMIKMSANNDNAVENTSIFAKINEITNSKYNTQALKIGVGLVLFQQVHRNLVALLLVPC
jgi:MFS family permease